VAHPVRPPSALSSARFHPPLPASATERLGEILLETHCIRIGEPMHSYRRAIAVAVVTAHFLGAIAIGCAVWS
jgi:hypothetical protein